VKPCLSLREHRTAIGRAMPGRPGGVTFASRVDRGIYAPDGEVVGQRVLLRLDQVAREDAVLQGTDSPLVTVSAARTAIRAGDRVGFLHTRDLDIEVFPKWISPDPTVVDPSAALGSIRGEFVDLLDFAGPRRLRPGLRARQQLKRRPLAEWMLHGMARTLVDALEDSLQHGYVERERALPFVRGRVLVGRQLRQGAGLPIPVWCRFESHESDTPLARLLALHAHTIAARSRWSQTRQLASRATRLLAGVAPSTHYEQDLAGLHFDRTNARFRDCIADLQLLLRRSRSDPSGASAATLGWSLSLSMSGVFERYVERVLRRICRLKSSPIDRLQTQKSVGSLAVKPPGFRQVPDVIVHLATGRTVIIDAKYKAPGKRGPSEADVRQVTAYANLYNLAEVEPARKCDTVVLLYPRAFESSPESARHRQWDLYPKPLVDTSDDKPPERRQRLKLLTRTIEFGRRPRGGAENGDLARMAAEIGQWLGATDRD